MASLIFNWKRVEAESRILKQSSEHRERHKARENVHARAMICFGFTSDWLKNWRENFEPITK